jgi:hypothetical protein
VNDLQTWQIIMIILSLPAAIALGWFIHWVTHL